MLVVVVEQLEVETVEGCGCWICRVRLASHLSDSGTFNSVEEKEVCSEQFGSDGDVKMIGCRDWLSTTDTLLPGFRCIRFRAT